MNNIDDFPHDCGGFFTEEQRREIEDIFSDDELLECMERGLANSGAWTDPALARQRRKEAIDAFSANPPEFWAMIGKQG